MASSNKPQPSAIDSYLVDIELMTEELAQPVMEVTLHEPLAFITPSGTVVMLPAFTHIYMHSLELGSEFKNSVKNLVAEAHYNEEMRIAKMTADERQAWLEAFIPF